MIKRDDSYLPPERLNAVKKEAHRALQKADAYGVFPTPVSQIIEMAKVELAPEDAFHIGLVRKFRKKFGDTLRRALSKVSGIFDVADRVIYIDQSLHAVKQTFLKLHEIAHSFMPWQRNLYSAIEDCKKTIESEQADAFDREANVFASEVLFQCNRFTEEAADCDFGILTPVKLSKKYGSSIYAAVRRYVRLNPKACAVLVINGPVLAEGDGFIATLRRVEMSESFLEQFGNIAFAEQFTPDDQIGAMIPVQKRKMTRPRIILLKDVNGVTHECVAEAFTQTYQVFILICPTLNLSSKSIVVPAFHIN